RATCREILGIELVRYVARVAGHQPVEGSLGRDGILRSIGQRSTQRCRHGKRNDAEPGMLQETAAGIAVGCMHCTYPYRVEWVKPLWSDQLGDSTPAHEQGSGERAGDADRP